MNPWWVRPNNGGLIIPMISEGSYVYHRAGGWPNEIAVLELGRRAATFHDRRGAA